MGTKMKNNIFIEIKHNNIIYLIAQIDKYLSI